MALDLTGRIAPARDVLKVRRRMHPVFLLQTRRRAVNIAHGCRDVDVAELLFDGKQTGPAIE